MNNVIRMNGVDTKVSDLEPWLADAVKAFVGDRSDRKPVSTTPYKKPSAPRNPKLRQYWHDGSDDAPVGLWHWSGGRWREIDEPID